MCYTCIDKGIWEQDPAQPCDVCGPRRAYTWASFDYADSDQNHHTRVDSDDDLLPAFANWVINFEARCIIPAKGMALHKSKYETICYAHNG
jgi:hypothetical protein